MEDELVRPSRFDKLMLALRQRMRRPLGNAPLVYLADDYFGKTFDSDDVSYAMSDHYSIAGKAFNTMTAKWMQRYARRRFRKEVTIIEPSKVDDNLDDYVRRRRAEALQAMRDQIPFKR